MNSRTQAKSDRDRDWDLDDVFQKYRETLFIFFKLEIIDTIFLPSYYNFKKIVNAFFCLGAVQALRNQFWGFFRPAPPPM